MHSNATEEINAKLHEQAVAHELKEMQEQAGHKNKENFLEIPEGQQQSKFLEQLEEQRMAFQGDFKDVDDEIKVQVKALVNNDFTVIKKIQQQEMSKGEIQFYLADDFKKKELTQQDTGAASDYDSDLNRTMYKEFWTDLSEFKPKVNKRTASVSKSTQESNKHSRNFGDRKSTISALPSIQLGVGMQSQAFDQARLRSMEQHE